MQPKISAECLVLVNGNNQYNIQEHYLVQKVKPNVAGKQDEEQGNGAPVKGKEVYNFHNHTATSPESYPLLLRYVGCRV